MAFTTSYVFNIKKDASLAAEKQWVVDVSYAPTAASVGSSLLATTPTAPTITTGPLGATGGASATYTHGDGTVTGFASPLDAVQRALVLMENDRSINNTYSNLFAVSAFSLLPAAPVPPHQGPFSHLTV